MDTLIKIAWRSLWRNKKRTLITTASVFTAVFLALFMRSMQIGSYDTMIKGVVTEVGHMQVQDSGYWESKSINDSFIYSEDFKNKIENIENVTSVIPRFETFALGSFGEMTKGLMIQGIIPEKEDPRKKISNKIIEGRYLTSNDNGIVLAEGLATYFKIGVNDSIVIMGQGYQGLPIYCLIPVVGIAKYPIPKLNNYIAYMSLSRVQAEFSPYHENLVSALVIDVEDDDDLVAETEAIKALIGSKYNVLSWDQMLPEVKQQIQADNVGGIIMLGILYLIVASGILGTVLMMTMERKKEFAIMAAVGMHRLKLGFVVFFETIFIGLIGVASGIAVGIPFLTYLYHNPIPLTGEMVDIMLEYNMEPVMPFSIESYIFSNQGIVILTLASLAAIYPVVYVFFFKILKAMRS